MSEAARMTPEAEKVWQACFPVPMETAEQLQRNTEQLGAYLAQMAKMMMRMQERLDDLEGRQAQVTLSHVEVKIIQGMIRVRSAEYCEKYEITDKGSLRSIGNGIRRAVLARYGVKDLHDVPAIARQAVEAQISRWSDMRLVMKCRERCRDGA